MMKVAAGALLTDYGHRLGAFSTETPIRARSGLGILVAEVALRPIDDSDLDALFEQMRDPESVRMAAFTAKNPDDRTAFDLPMAKLGTSPEVTTRAITVDGRLVGSIAGRALALFLD
jgi:hypothetical protein